MAIRVCGFVCFESEEDFDNSVRVRGYGQLRYGDGAIEKPTKFPACFEHVTSDFDDLCGDWIMQKDFFAMLQAIAEKEQHYRNLRKKIEKTLDNRPEE